MDFHHTTPSVGSADGIRHTTSAPPVVGGWWTIPHRMQPDWLECIGTLCCTAAAINVVYALHLLYLQFRKPTADRQPFYFFFFYRSPHDIDLYAGGISETPVRGGILGPTFSCLLAYQFSLYKHGDRFWYENNDHENPRAAFTQGKCIRWNCQGRLIKDILRQVSSH